MKHTQTFTVLALVISSLVLAWAVPAVVRIATSTGQNYPFLYYSSILQRFIVKEQADTQATYTDTDGNQYTREQYDSLTPMLSYRQLLLTGGLPDTLLGVAIDPHVLRQKQVVWRYTPRAVNTPAMALYIMYDAMSGRATIDSPDDVFRLRHRIEFIDKRTNRVNEEKSALFQERLTTEGFTFPALEVWGNLSARKPYDEGYFVLDARRRLFHLKMVNGRPFVRDTRAASDSLAPAHFVMTPVSDRRFYGFLFDAAGAMYILETPHCRLLKLDIPPVDLTSDEIMIMGNMFFWTVSVMNPEGRHYYALENDSLQRVDALFIAAAPTLWNRCSAWLFPTYLTFESRSSDYLKPRLHPVAWTGFACNLAAAALFVALARRKRKCAWRHGVYILLTGIAGLIALFIIPRDA